MAAPAINRLVLTDDDGTGLTGTPLNNALFQDLQNRIDQLSAAIVAQFPAGGSIITSANFADALQNSASARTLTYGNVAACNVDRSGFDVAVVIAVAQPLTIPAPIWSGAGGVTAYDEANLVYRIWDNGVRQPLSWSASHYPMVGIPLPTQTSGSPQHFGFRYSTPHNVWFCVAIASN